MTAGTYVPPQIMLTRPGYARPPFDNDAVRRLFTDALATLAAVVKANQPGSGAWVADDMAVWFRSLSFLSDDAFAAAVGPHLCDAPLRARLWRVYTACWAAQSCAWLDGAFLDVGCYTGAVADILYRYCGAAAETRAWHLSDVFDPPPAVLRKRGHGSALEGEVRRLFAGRPNVSVDAGLLPGALVVPPRVAFVHLDLNDGATELAVLDRAWDALVVGGMVVLDDYGDAEYRATQDRQRAFFAARGQSVYESPTGQGLVIRR